MNYKIIPAIFIVFSLKVSAAEDYKIRDILISGEAESAKIAKAQAIEEGKRRAFITLMYKINPNIDPSVESVTSSEAETLVQEYELKDEKFSNKSYRATLNVLFNPTLVQKRLESLKETNEPILAEPKIRGANSEDLSSNEVTCFTKIDSMQEWLDIKEILESRIEGIEDVFPITMDKHEVMFKLIFSVDIEELAEQLFDNDILLYDRGGEIELEAVK